MDFDDLTELREPPPNRVGKSDGPQERHLTEGAVMLAWAMYLLRVEEVREVHLHPDGEHGKRFDFVSRLERRGFGKVEKRGKTTYGGLYRDADARRLIIDPRPGRGDVVAIDGDRPVVAECKGGIINTRHPGQRSRLNRGLCEAVGRLIASERTARQIAVVPRTDVTERLAGRLAERCASVGIEIALVGSRGEIEIVRA